MNANLKSIPPTAGTLCAAALLLSACATTAPEMPPELEPEDYVGCELKTTNAAYAEDSDGEYRVLKNGFGETQEAAVEDARKNAEAEMAKKIDRLLRSVPAGTEARERARAALLATMRASAPDMWDFRAPGAARHKATISARCGKTPSKKSAASSKKSENARRSCRRRSKRSKSARNAFPRRFPA